MGADEVANVPFGSNAVDNSGYSDTALVDAVRNALASVKNVSAAQVMLLPHVHICVYTVRACVCLCSFSVMAVFSKKNFLY